MVIGVACGSVLDNRNLVSQIHCRSHGGFKASMGNEPDGNQLLNATLLQQQIEVRIGEPARTPVNWLRDPYCDRQATAAASRGSRKAKAGMMLRYEDR